MSNYKPGELLDAIKKELGIFTDKSLSQLLGISHCDVSAVRTHRAPLNSDFILRVHHITGWGVDYIRGLAGDESEGLFRRPAGGRYNFYWKQS